MRIDGSRGGDIHGRTIDPNGRCPMRPRIRGFLVTAMALSLLALTAHRSAAKCDVTGADAAAVAEARRQVKLGCPCDSFTNHGQYVSCAAGAAKTALQDTNPSCKGAVVKCAAKSTCGKSGFVTCCRTSAKGVTKCSTKSDGDHCKVPKGGSACVALGIPSCCDACSATGCNASPSGAFLGTGF